jgi:hypothetical protein
MQKTFLLTGGLFIIIGLLLPWFQKMGIGHLPGDISIKRGNLTFYFPLATCLILSLLLSIIMRIFK